MATGHNHYTVQIWAIFQVVLSQVLAVPIPPTVTLFRHFGSLGENFLVNNCGMIHFESTLTHVFLSHFQNESYTFQVDYS